MPSKSSLAKPKLQAIAPRSPFVSEHLREIERMKREMDRLWESFWPERGGRTEMLSTQWFPEFDLSETENEIILRAEIPGINPDEVDISLINNTLTIKGEKKQELEQNKETYHFLGRSYGAFSRSISLPVEVKEEEVNASYKNGVLTVILPKSEQAKHKQIKINVES